MTKICNVCKTELDHKHFHKSTKSLDGLQSRCKSCIGNYNKERYALKHAEIRKKQNEFNAQNRDQVLSQKRASHARLKDSINTKRRQKYLQAKELGVVEQWRDTNPEAYLNWRRQYREKNKEKINEKKRKYAQKNRDKINQQQKDCYHKHRESRRLRAKYAYQKHGKKYAKAQVIRRNRDPLERLKHTLRNRTRQALLGKTKPESTQQLLGCTWEQAREHIEAQFKPDMSWGNYGPKGWHIDHIKPIASFDLTDPEQCRQAFHWTNLQPLWASENLAKGARTP